MTGSPTVFVFSRRETLFLLLWSCSLLWRKLYWGWKPCSCFCSTTLCYGRGNCRGTELTRKDKKLNGQTLGGASCYCGDKPETELGGGSLCWVDSITAWQAELGTFFNFLFQLESWLSSSVPPEPWVSQVHPGLSSLWPGQVWTWTWSTWYRTEAKSERLHDLPTEIISSLSVSVKRKDREV